nr:ycf68 protein [Ipomoea batatas]GMC59414.1 ycf68 protein [Ipomoea batatas]GMD74129.1 ycf68 protein [Ipomoea batatas]GMD84643.1 ycf68 protein [Ipomoea batatas]
MGTWGQKKEREGWGFSCFWQCEPRGRLARQAISSVVERTPDKCVVVSGCEGSQILICTLSTPILHSLQASPSTKRTIYIYMSDLEAAMLLPCTQTLQDRTTFNNSLH